MKHIILTALGFVIATVGKSVLDCREKPCGGVRMFTGAHRAVIVLLVVVFTTSAATAADLFEYGSIQDLKGVKKFYVDAGDDLDLRDIIKSRLEQLQGVKVVDRPEEAEHWVVFRWWLAGPDTYRARTIVITGGATQRRRLLFTDRSSESEPTDVADDGGKAVAKAYRRVNEK